MPTFHQPIIFKSQISVAWNIGTFETSQILILSFPLQGNRSEMEICQVEVLRRGWLILEKTQNEKIEMSSQIGVIIAKKNIRDIARKFN